MLQRYCRGAAEVLQREVADADADAEMQRCRDAEMQRCRDAEVQRCRVEACVQSCDRCTEAMQVREQQNRESGG